ncbi:NTP transferase domain-containing protein [Candidatus Woesearchaeota archaeon]|nr:NTP transferase domain-containing protein [Candidatus Woesearchaeota archaeon]
MKGVILAGGKGTRMMPLTKVTNKHLLPIYNEPMIYYPIKTLAAAGIKDILIVVGGESMGEFLRLLGSGREFGVNLTYRCQEGAGGIPAALALAKEFADNDRVMVVLGDNVMDESLKEEAHKFESGNSGCHIFLKEVHDPQRYGVVELDGGKVVAIHEKPEKPPTNLCVTGVYMFDSAVFGIIPDMKPSRRGELEIVDVLNHYLKEGRLSWSRLKGYWTDAGTFEAWFEANAIVRENSIKGGK